MTNSGSNSFAFAFAFSFEGTESLVNEVRIINSPIIGLTFDS
ncbi:hypothetical protein LINGRAPRIM_LOCUS2223 [Linum grandiflorum]